MQAAIITIAVWYRTTHQTPRCEFSGALPDKSVRVDFMAE